MTGQLDLFRQASEREPKAADDLSGAPAPDEAPVSQPDAGTAEAASRSEQHDHAGQLGDDGTLHYMLTGRPESEAA